ncbi:MAG: hypothetical protein A2V90_05385 [Gammaproteobacteria bacterium RBG_16_57_12]|nr:MAG: hypothetical protein A2V90_05385 [Gammaproteobacteria bacterium RBG_16_57_12]
MDACAFNALTLSEDSINLDERSCTSCGACVPSCPGGVFSLSNFYPRSFMEAIGGAIEAHIHCGASAANEGDVEIPCHQLLDARLVAAAHAAGSETIHLHGLGHCTRCDKGSAVAHISSVKTRLSQWFGEAAASRLLVADHKEMAHPHNEPTLNRRGFLRLAGQGVVASTCSLLIAAEHEDTSPANQGFNQVDVERQQPAVYQSLLAERAQELPWVAGMLPWYRRTISNDCNACLACGQRCPTGALRATQSAASRGIDFALALCTDCGLCDRLCPMEAIARQPITDAAEVMARRSTLMSRPQAMCRQCGSIFVVRSPDEELCHFCTNEQKIRQGWLSMVRPQMPTSSAGSQ